MSIKIEQVKVTPEDAVKWLQTNTRNRRISQQTVAAYSRDMEQGKWKLTTETVKFADSGKLIDGQHRLSAVIRSGSSVDMFVARGLDEQTQDVLDAGMKRSVGAQLGMKGYKYPSVIAAISTIAVRWEVENIVLRGETRLKVTNSEQLEWIEAHPEVEESAKEANKMRVALGGGSDAAMGFMHWHTHQMKPLVASEFWYGVLSGSMLTEGDPRLALRNGIMRRNASRSATDGSKTIVFAELFLNLAARAWNAWRKGETLTVMKISEPDKQPVFTAR